MRTGIFNVKGWEMEVVYKNCLGMVPCDKIQSDSIFLEFCIKYQQIVFFRNHFALEAKITLLLKSHVTHVFYFLFVKIQRRKPQKFCYILNHENFFANGF